MLPQPVLEYWNLVISIGFTDNGGWTGSDLRVLLGRSLHISSTR
ncbi:hypothetical protein ACP70R_027073 [Stipagrostis hirtigluma subsp. patula]